jgi:hypothetical protein
MRIEKSPFSQWRRNSKANTSSGSHRKNQTRGDKKQNKKQKTHTGMNKSGSLTPVQGPSTVVCMIVTKLSQLPHWLHQLPTVGKGQWQAPSCELSFCCNSGSNGKTQPYYWLATDPTTKTRQRNKERQEGKRTGKGKEQAKTVCNSGREEWGEWGKEEGKNGSYRWCRSWPSPQLYPQNASHTNNNHPDLIRTKDFL